MAADDPRSRSRPPADGPPGEGEAHPDQDGGAERDEGAVEAELLRGLFLEEALAHLSELHEALHALGAAAEAEERASAAETMLRRLHNLKGGAGSVGLETISQAAHEIEELCAEIRAGSLFPTPGILDRIEESLGGLHALLEGARAAPLPGRAADPLLEDSAQEPSERRVRDRRRGIERRAGGDRSLRVDTVRLDALSDRVGDLVILRTRIERRLRELEGVLRDLETSRARLRQTLAAAEPAAAGAAESLSPAATLEPLLDRLVETEIELGGVSAHLDRATRALALEGESLRRTGSELDEELRRARLIPLDWAFARLPHALRELERTTGRIADLELQGGEVEVDKALAEQMGEALLHLLRNAVAHGLESPGERAAAGKPERGRIRVNASQQGDLVLIEFADDGRGVDHQEVKRALARAGAAVPAPGAAGDREVLAAIFEPGFTIRQAADGLAGRGMGLDIVKRTVVRLGGEVSVESRAGKGTHFRVVVPVHASITEAVLFKTGGQVYALPAAHVVRALPLGPGAPLVKEGAGEAWVAPAAEGGARLPVLRLSSLLGVEPSPGGRATALQVRYGERSFIITCDKMIGPRTIVVKPLGPVLGLLPLFAGVTISGAGKAQLVLDPGALADAAAAPLRPAPPGARRSAPRILVADDSRLAREATARVLIASGFQAVTAEDGWEAWELLGERRFDALITDLEMPRLDGFELITRVRQEPTLKALPILVMSSRTASAARERALSAGASALLPKGPHKKVLVDTIAALLAPGGRPP